MSSSIGNSARARYRAGNRSPRHEHQAHRASRAFVRGERDLHRMLTPAAGSSFVLGSSAGQSLPQTLRGELEEAFSADLGVVRIHSDVTAATAARTFHASAFVSGRDIYFGAGYYDPSSLAGRELIAHEVAHVLQQTARRSNDGMLTATVTHGGDGFIQCQDVAASDLPGDPTVFESLVSLHTRSGPSTDLQHTIEQVRELVQGQLVNNQSRPRFGLPLADAVNQRSEFLTGSIRSRAFVLDALKLLGYFHAAKAVIDSDTRLEMQVVTPSGPFLQFLRTQPDAYSWSADALRHPSLQEQWPSVIVSAYRDFLLSPHSPPPRLNPRLLTRMSDEFEQRVTAINARRFVPQERVYMAWEALAATDQWRVRDCELLRGEFERGYSALVPTERLARGIQQLRAREQQILDAGTDLPHRRLLAERLVTMIDAEIAPLWAQVLADVNELRLRFEAFSDRQLLNTSVSRAMRSDGSEDGDDAAFDLVEQPRFPASGIREEFATRLHAVILEHTLSIFAEGGGTPSSPGGPASGDSLPSPTIYAARLAALRAALESPTIVSGRTQRALLEELDALLLRRARERRPNQELVRALAVLSFFVDYIIHASAQYNVAADALSTSYRDELGFHRVFLGRSLARFSRWMGWTDVVEAVHRTMPVDVTGGVPQLWLNSEWEVDENSRVGRIAEDFPETLDEPFVPGLPLTIRHVMSWFLLDYDLRLKALLESQLQLEHRGVTAETELDIGAFARLRQSPESVRATMLRHAQAEIDADARGEAAESFGLLMPQRFMVEEWDTVLPPEREGDWGLLIHSHPKTRASILRHLSTAPFTYVLVPQRYRRSVFLWVLPSLQGLVQVVRGLSSLERFANTRAGLDAYLASLDRDTVAPEVWSDIDQAIRNRIRSEHTRVREELPDLWTRFTTLRRRILVMGLRDRFAGYLADRRVTGGGILAFTEEDARRISTPQDALTEVLAFQSDVRPAEDTDAQVALLFLSLAPEMQRMFTPLTPEYRTAAGYFRFIEQTIAYVTAGPENLQAMRRVTNIHDPADVFPNIESRRTTALDQLRAAKRAIEMNYAESQAATGFRTTMEEGERVISTQAFPGFTIKPVRSEDIDNPTASHAWRENMTADETGHLDDVSGDLIRLVSIERDFEYRPAVGTPGSGPYIAPYYKRLPSGEEFGGTTGRPLPDDLLFEIRINAETIEVRANQPDAVLARYNEMFLWRSFQLSMENLHDLGVASMQWMVAVSSLIPGVGLAEVTTNVMAFVATNELPETIAQLRDDPMELIEGMMERFRNELLRPENIWRFLLLAGQHNPWRELVRARPRRSGGTLPPPRTRIGRVVRSLRSLGERLHNALNRVRERARGPIRATQGNIAMRPTLSWVLRRAARVMAILPDLIPPEWVEGAVRGEIPLTPAAISASIRERADETAGGLRENTFRLLEGIQHIELPGELIDLTVATELIAQLIADRFGPRARLVRKAMELIPVPQSEDGNFSGFKSLYTHLSEKIAEVWRGSPVDPNVYWRDRVRPLIEDRFVELRDELVDGLYGMVNTLLRTLGIEQIEQPPRGSLPQTEVIATSLDTEASLGDSVPSDFGRGWQVPAGGGQAMPSTLRSGFERQFGQDLSHVRLHTGESARAATVPIGANALTSGSHIYLRPGITPQSSGARGLLAHELTHVVQQVGSNRLGESAPRPVMGSRTRLRFDASRERHAEHAARSVTASRSHIDSPVSSRMDGAQPALSDRTMASIIDTLTQVRSEEDFTASGSSTHIQGLEDARQLWEQVWTKLGQLNPESAADFAAFTANPTSHPTPNVRVRIREHVRRERAPINNAIEGITRLSQRPRSPRVRGQPENELNPRRFIDLLESFIFAERGIGLKISLDATQHTVDNIKVISVEMDRIGGTSELWTIAVAAAFSGRAGITVNADLQNSVRQRLRALGPQAVVWDHNEFKFSAHFVDEFMEIKEAALRGSVTTVPPKSEYIRPDNSRGDSLAVGTHSQLTQQGRNIGTYGRESHHTTQFLLSEFFSNHPDATRVAFPPHHAGNYPSAVKFENETTGTGRVRSIEAPGRPPIQAAALDPNSGRGDAMPAILLSARTHRRGELHVLNEPIWREPAENVDADNKRTQSIAIENVFTRNLPEALRPRANSAERIESLRAAVEHDPAAANRAFYDATVATYHWMYNRMIPALETALKTEELAYYTSIAALTPGGTVGGTTDTPDLHSDYRLTEPDMTAVFRAAKVNNDRIMSRFGWPTPS